jgi:hypothetical protein
MAILLESFAVFLGLGLLFLGTVLFFGMRRLRGDGGGRSAAEREQETQFVQAVYQSMSRLEDRVAALETILASKEIEKEMDLREMQEKEADEPQ